MTNHCPCQSVRHSHMCSQPQVRLQYYPDGYEWAEDMPVLISEGYGGHAAGVSGRQTLPGKFNVSRGQSLQGIYLNRQIVSEWADEKVLPPRL